MSEIPYFVRYKDVTTLDGTESIYLDDANSDVPKKILVSDFGNSGIVTNKEYVTKTANYTLTSTDCVVECNGTFTITLPTSEGKKGKEYIVINNGSGTITIYTTLSQTISGDLTQSVYPSEVFSIVSNGNNWIVI